MKNQFLTCRQLTMAALLVSGCSVVALAQSEKKTEKGQSGVTVKVIERTDAGEMRELERTYRIDGMTDKERDKLVNRIVDSVRTKRGDKKGQVTVILEDTDSDQNRLEVHQYGPNGNRADIRQQSRPRRDPKERDAYARRPTPYEFRMYRDGKLQNHYRFDPDSLADRLKRFDFKWPENFSQRMDDAFRGWSWSSDGESGKASTIRSLQVYPNNPETNELNVRFTAPTKGDVRIRVTTPDGKEVARKDVKDFSGNYAGQLDLGKKTNGVFFVNVTQNDDGAVKRIVIP